jgi:hypothetical protein
MPEPSSSSDATWTASRVFPTPPGPRVVIGTARLAPPYPRHSPPQPERYWPVTSDAGRRWPNSAASSASRPSPVAHHAGLFAASRQGEFAAVDPTLERLLGRPPMSMRDVLAASLSS